LRAQQAALNPPTQRFQATGNSRNAMSGRF
jgi:hypothetical protein